MGKNRIIDKGILIEDLVNLYPESVTYLMNKGIKCIACGEPIWGSLEDVAKEKGFNDREIDAFVNDLNAMYTFMGA